jgi:4-amino-4-deoxy-L-arabinose transferase-like glycosyltransferase
VKASYPGSKALDLFALCIAGLLAFLLFFASRFWLHQAASEPLFGPGVWLFLTLLFCFSLLTLQVPQIAASGGRRLLWLCLALAALLFGELLLWTRGWPTERYLWPGYLFLLGGSGALFRTFNRRDPGPSQGLSRGWEFGALALLLVFGLWVRCFRLGDFPLTWSYDEVDAARLSQQAVLEAGQAPIFLNDFHNPGLFFWIGGLACRIFGTSVQTLRGLSAFWGWMALLPFYGLARRLLGARWGLAALAIFCAMRWTLIPERIAFTSSFALFWILTAVYFAWVALEKKRPRDLALAGLTLGMTLHAYNPSRMMLLIALLYALIHWRRLKGISAASWGLFAGCFLLVAAPMLLYMATHWSVYAARTRSASILGDIDAKGWGQLWISFGRHLRCFNFSGDMNARHNIHGWPQLDFLTGAFFIPSLLWAHGRFRRDARATLFCLWFWVMLSQGIFSVASEAPQANRTILITPALALMVAWFLGEAAERLRDLWAPPAWPRPLALGLAVSLLAIPAFNAAEVFGAWTDDPATPRYFAPESTSAARRAVAQGPDWLIYHADLYQAVNGYPQMERAFFLRFLLKQEGRELHALGYPTTELEPFADRTPQGVLLIWATTDVIISQALERQYPDLKVEPFLGISEDRFDYRVLAVPWDRIPRKGPFAGSRPLLLRP